MNSISFTLEQESKIKLYYQLYEKISELIKDGTYKPNSKIPSIRTISTKLDVSKNTVAKAYELLEKNHFIYSEQKRGYFVMDLSSVPIDQPMDKNPQQDETVDDGIPTVDAILKQRQEEAEFESVPINHEPQKTQSIDADELKQLEDLSKSFVEKQSVTIETDQIETKVTEKTVPEQQNSQSVTKSLEEKFLDCFSRIVIQNVGQDLTNKSQDIEKKFKQSIANFLSEFLEIPCSEEQIIISASHDLLLSSIVHLQSLNTPYIKSNGVGLLRLANQFTSGNLTTVKPVTAIPEDTDFNTQKIFSNANLPTNLSPLCEFGLDPDFLITSGATSALMYPRDIPDFIIQEPKTYIQTILDWANQASYRYIIEYETDSPKSGQKIRLKTFDKQDKVVYINSFENLLPFNLKCAFAILPKNIYADYQQKYDCFNSQVSLLEQQVLTDFIDKAYMKEYLWPNEK